MTPNITSFAQRCPPNLVALPAPPATPQLPVCVFTVCVTTASCVCHLLCVSPQLPVCVCTLQAAAADAAASLQQLAATLRGKKPAPAPASPSPAGATAAAAGTAGAPPKRVSRMEAFKPKPVRGCVGMGACLGVVWGGGCLGRRGQAGALMSLRAGAHVWCVLRCFSRFPVCVLLCVSAACVPIPIEHACVGPVYPAPVCPVCLACLPARNGGSLVSQPLHMRRGPKG